MKNNTITKTIGMICIICLSCSTGKKKDEYKFSNDIIISGADAVRSADKIDRYATYEIFFTLNEDTETMKISITAKGQPDPLTKKSAILKTYFIVEKVIDLSQFKNRNLRFTFSELGRNYDTMWNRKRELLLSSIKTDYIRTLDTKSIFRIRYTTFSEEFADFSVKIEADSAVTFSPKFPR